MSEQEEKTLLMKKILHHKKLAESNIVLSMYKNTDLYYDNNVKLDNFSNKVWKFYFDLLEKGIKRQIKKFDDITVNSLVDDIGGDFKNQFIENGGFETIENGIEMVSEENFDSHFITLAKINTITKLIAKKFHIKTVEQYEGLMELSLQDIRVKFESSLESCFDEFETGEKIEDLSEGLWDMIEEADEGIFKGFPYNSKLLNHYTNGQLLGNITMLSANSGVGKTFLTVAEVLPSFIDNKFGNISLTIMANEEDSRKWKQAIVVWVANNILDGDFDKGRFLKGGFSKEERTILRKSVDWLEEHMKSGVIEFVGFNNFSMKKSISIIKRQAKMKGTKYFILDTLKMDADAKESDQVWLQLQRNMVHLYDTVKSQTLNCHVFVTYQLGKSAMQRGYLDQSALGVSKNVVDVVSTLLLARKAFDKEKRKNGASEGGLQVREHGVEGLVKYMSEDKEYFIVFPAKNRFGTTSEQMVFEVDMAKNTIKDFGYVKIEQDF